MYPSIMEKLLVPQRLDYTDIKPLAVTIDRFNAWDAGLFVDTDPLIVT